MILNVDFSRRVTRKPAASNHMCSPHFCPDDPDVTVCSQPYSKKNVAKLDMFEGTPFD